MYIQFLDPSRAEMSEKIGPFAWVQCTYNELRAQRVEQLEEEIAYYGHQPDYMIDGWH